MNPFQIAIPDADIADLHARLANTRWPEDLNDDAWSYGTRADFLKSLCDHWRTTYDWRAAEARLNRLPQFTTAIDGLILHFVHLRGQGPNPTPLLITHGWPGSFIEMERLIPLLTAPDATGRSFDLIIPSLPGFGFSSRPTAPGCGPKAIAAIWAKLMTVLGYDTFAVQGGDWGAIISTWLARDFPTRVTAAHLNMFAASIPPGDTPYNDAEETYLANVRRWRDTEGAYGIIQGTKPQTLGYGLTDSPAALAGWISEKFRAWSDCHGDIPTAISLDDLLTNISIYWFTGNITSSLRIYKESRATPLALHAGEHVPTPIGYTHFPTEIFNPPRCYAEHAFNIRHWTEQPKGGHFAALEQPEALAADIRAFFRGLS